MINTPFKEMAASVPKEIMTEADMSFAISDRLNELIKSRGMTKKEFAEAIGCRPSEVTKWLSGQQNFTIRTLARLSTFFGEPLVCVVDSEIESVCSSNAS